MSTANPGEREPAKPAAPDLPQRGRRPSDTFSNRLILAIRLTGLTIREFADEAGLDDGSVSNWTRGMRPRDLVGICQAIADAHDIDRDWLLLGGPLLPARGRPSRRGNGLNPGSVQWPIRPADTRPIGRPLDASPAQATRRPRIVDRTHRLAV